MFFDADRVATGRASPERKTTAIWRRLDEEEQHTVVSGTRASPKTKRLSSSVENDAPYAVERLGQSRQRKVRQDINPKTRALRRRENPLDSSLEEGPNEGIGPRVAARRRFEALVFVVASVGTSFLQIDKEIEPKQSSSSEVSFTIDSSLPDVKVSTLFQSSSAVPPTVLSRSKTQTELSP
ncbi:hypothetical protein F2Q70_00028003 [Brassica cretica]|uniref:Uncharacterized protein n=1 Tax=Brassica cretica TaxID=69181 RepID=A0A8S9LD42_BRACR|nr:hypothetical protein F2Q70_00028003 [Brassica cretica]